MSTPSRNIRVSDDLWFAAQEEAVRRGESVSAAIIRFLADYTGRPGAALTPTERAIQRRRSKAG